MFGPGLWPRRRSADVGLFPVLPRAEPADAEPDCRDACPGQRYPWWSFIPGDPTRSAEAVRLADALHLAAAIEFGCEVFLTNDNQLANFPDITVEELP